MCVLVISDSPQGRQNFKAMSECRLIEGTSVVGSGRKIVVEQPLVSIGGMLTTTESVLLAEEMLRQPDGIFEKCFLL